MTDREKLIEAMCEAAVDSAFGAGAWQTFVGQDSWRKSMHAALAAIDASGTHWLAPWEATEAMDEAGSDSAPGRMYWEIMRDAYLAERAKERREGRTPPPPDA